jgi:hypothetical protein
MVNKKITEWVNENQNKHLCECGCGNTIKILRRHYSRDIPKYIKGHRKAKTINDIDKFIKENQGKHFCQCGCGEEIIILEDHYHHRNSRGIPKYITGHRNIIKKVDEFIKENQGKYFCCCGCNEEIKIERRYFHTGIPKYILGHHPLTEDEKDKLRIAWSGKNNPMKKIDVRKKVSATNQCISYDEWESFASYQKYCPDFNEECKESNREKYDRKCFLTGLPEEENITQNGKQIKLAVHHVDMDKGQGCSGIKWKLVPLSMSWHSKVHNELWEARIIWLLDNVWGK